MDFKKMILFALIGFLISGAFFGTILYFTVFKTPRQVTKPLPTYEYNIGSFSTNLGHQRNFFKGEIVIETINKNVYEEFAKKDTELKDQIIEVLIAKEPEDILNPEGQQKLKQELIERISEIMASDEITNLYFIDYIVQ
ncbi:MAG: flagellar basal body protein FliL [Clostridiales bacterium]|nr:flagellar basal body protein FliL [Clostridiales bacterium]